MSHESGTLRFQRQQLAFAAHIRDPDRQPVPPGIPHRRMAVYTEIFFNNLNEQLSGSFPILRRISNDERWRALVRDFMIRHRCSTPLFTEIGQEFIEYLQNERAAPGDWPFQTELAHYEYVELAVAIDPGDELPDGVDPNGDLVSRCPVLAPTAWSLSYTWPVHLIGPDYLPEAPPEEPTHLVVYRDRRDDVRFLQINPLAQRLLQLLRNDGDRTGLDALQLIARDIGHPDVAQLVEFGRGLLEELRRRNVILGTRH